LQSKLQRRVRQSRRGVAKQWFLLAQINAGRHEVLAACDQISGTPYLQRKRFASREALGTVQKYPLEVTYFFGPRQIA
jgi:hypothetical protein